MSSLSDIIIQTMLFASLVLLFIYFSFYIYESNKNRLARRNTSMDTSCHIIRPNGRMDLVEGTKIEENGFSNN